MAERNFIASQAEDVEAMIETVHRASPGYAQTLAMFEQITATFDLRYRLLDFRLIALDGEYAYARAVQETRKHSGPDFVDNVATFVWIFRQDADGWKLWNQAILEVDPY